MKGIDRTRHRQVMQALAELEQLEARYQADPAHQEQTAAHRAALQEWFAGYQDLLQRLDEHIRHYDQLVAEVQYRHLNPRLRQLRKTTPAIRSAGMEDRECNQEYILCDCTQ